MIPGAAGRPKKMQNFNNLIGNESATFWLVAQCLNHVRVKLDEDTSDNICRILVRIQP
jgi:hypothetical protein